MASLYFYFSSMDSGKSTYLLQSAHNYETAGKRVLLLAPNVDDRYGVGKITSRIGLQREVIAFGAQEQLFERIHHENDNSRISCVMIDEAHFLSPQQVWQLSDAVDKLNIPILCFGLRTDAFGEAFASSGVLLSIADELCELKSICKKCEKKASMQVRMDANGRVVTSGNIVHIGSNDTYLSVCRKHYKELMGL